jgi:hypothetical protein
VGNSHAVGIEVRKVPPWLKEAAPGIEFLYLAKGVCDLCEKHGDHRWQTRQYHYVYCRECLVETSLHLGPAGIV